MIAKPPLFLIWKETLDKFDDPVSLAYFVHLCAMEDGQIFEDGHLEARLGISLEHGLKIQHELIDLGYMTGPKDRRKFMYGSKP